MGFMLPAEEVTFSARGQLLVSKLGRSSKPSPRFIVVVSTSSGLCYRHF